MNVTPRAGGRFSWYGEADGPGATTGQEERAVFNTGAEVSFKASRTWTGAKSKFWEIDIAGTDVTVRYGRIGADGQTKTKSFADESAAQKHADGLIEEKTEKGYAEK